MRRQDEELPDYIMVMVANKKSQEQMAEDLALFLGSNTLKFTVWLHGVLDKLRSVTVEPTTAKEQLDYTESDVLPSEKSQAAVSGSTSEDLRILAVSSTHPEKTDSRVTTSSLQEQAMPTIRSTLERSSSLLTSAVKPLTEVVSCEAVIDIKPEPDDLIDGDLNILQELPSSSKKKPMVTVSYNVPCPSFDTFTPEENVSQIYKTTEASTQSLRVAQNTVPPCKLGEGSFHGYRLSENTNVYRSYESTLQTCNRLSESGVQVYRSSKFDSDRSSRDDEGYKKRKASIISSVVKINKSSEGEEDDDDFGSRAGSLSSSISVPAKPERRPTLPPSKQANKNLILKAITEAQKSVAKTTSYPAVLQKQMVPVAPRTRAVRESSETEVINPVDKPHQHDIQLQSNVADQPVQKYYLQPIEAKPGGDTRSFILKKPVLEGVESQLQGKAAVCVEGVSTEQDRPVQTKDQADSEESSPKFIVTLDGIPSPPGSISEQDEETEPLDQGSHLQEGGRKCRVSMQSVAQTLIESDEEIDDSNFQAKRQKLLERCKYWPACKNGDNCMYHHPVSSCKTFPKCKYGDKCLFIHPNCKYDSKCTRLDCPYTHASRRAAIVPKQPAPVTNPGSSLCRFFPDCKKVECSFIHPKPCRFSAHCKRADCTFYHPTITLPPRHALKWIRSQQNSE
ncbi:zinc finger CCCH domain-containing protein 14 isoform X2 [Narcine bancroftii]|uniref:zinc finger CCCH domain-containing protein 14 isoform X2 n=1 Tax=Narcine bancroftii TaxID=1343680 RepID=UPI0038320A3A